MDSITEKVKVISSTNRSNARDVHIADYYVTPVKDIELFLREFDKRIKLDWNNMKIIDPCAGGNKEIKDSNGIKELYHPMSYQTAIQNVFGKVNVHNIDIRENSLAETKGDYLKMNVKTFSPQIIITNPPFNCFSEDTEIKTRNGWKKYKELTKDDEVLSCNINTQELEWSKINCIIEKDYCGDIIHFNHRFLDMKVTPEHRMFSYKNSAPQFNRKNSDVILAEDIDSKSYIPKKGYIWNGIDEDFVLPGCYVSNGQIDIWHEPLTIKLNTWVQFMGVWLSDGYYRHTLNSNGDQRYTCGIKQKEQNDKKLIEILEQLPFEYKIYRDYKTGKNNYEIHSKQLWVYMSQFGYSKDKYVPDNIKNSSKEILKIFLDSYIYGDSTKCENGYILQSISKKLMEDIHEIILKLGYLSHMRCQDTKYKGKEYLVYQITYCPEKTIQNRIYYCTKKQYKTIEKYKGKVFCLNLEKNGFFLLRRNEYEFFSGNCAIPIIEKALDDVAENGYVIMLLRLNFFGSKERKPFFDKYIPEWCFVHHARIGFTDKKDESGYVLFDKNGQTKRGSTDSIEYMHAVWRKGYKPEYTKLVVI